jgi:Cupin domain.
MISRKGREQIRKDHICGGNGYILREDLLSPECLGDHCKVFSIISLKPGCEVGYHEHHGDGEAYYLLSGAGVYLDNKNPIPVEYGDVTFCEDGNGHGIKNTGNEDLKFIASILQKSRGGEE